ncbi:MAG: MOSC domain-containing protein [Rubripirellula sp.]
MGIQQGILIGIARREKTRAPMEEIESALVTTKSGIEKDFRGKPGNRQITILAEEDWESACKTMEKNLPWTLRRANLLVKGIKLQETTDSLIQIGNLTLQVTGETDPCSRMDEEVPGLTKALLPDWRGGVLCRVIADGKISLGNQVTLETPK